MNSADCKNIIREIRQRLDALEDFLCIEERDSRFDDVIKKTCAEFGFSVSVVTDSRLRTAAVSDCRAAAMFLCVEEIYPTPTREAIAMAFNRDGSAITHAHKKAINLMAIDPKFRAKIEAIREKLK